jgi:hypothetical protein
MKTSAPKVASTCPLGQQTLPSAYARPFHSGLGESMADMQGTQPSTRGRACERIGARSRRRGH